MKKATLILVCACLFSFGLANAQQRTVLVEEFTQASCPPCASQNPGFNSLLSDNQTKVVSVKYHTWWPGVDQMYDDNSNDADDRISYYNVNGVPTGIIDGSYISNDCNAYDGAPACLSQTDIDDEYAVPSPFTISVTHYLSADLDSIYASVTITATDDVSGNLKARIAVTEKEVQFASPPGTNGETEFPDVMKKMLPTSDGTVLPSSISSGWATTIDVSWALSNIYDYSQIAVVAWVQNDDDQSVLQAGISEPQPLNLDGSVTTYSSAFLQCNSSFSPSIEISNPGLTELTSADVQYKVDNGNYQTTSWSGSLESGTNTQFNLPDVTATTGTHKITANLLNINGETDLNTGNNSIVGTFGVPNATPAIAPVIEGFVTSTFPPTDWLIDNPDQQSTWIRNTQVGGYQATTNSTKYAFYSITPGAIDELYIKNVDLSDITQPSAELSFDIAKAKYTGYIDELQVAVSTDCGEDWTTVYDKTDASGLSTATSSSDWKPSATQWRTDNVDLTSYISNANVFVKFVAISGYGNNMYLDNINLHYGATTGISSIHENNVANIYPNPASDLAVLQVSVANPSDVVMEIFNSLGQRVMSNDFGVITGNHEFSVNLNALSEGVYNVRINSGDHYSSMKLIVSK